jgi:hypothetical protein
MTDIKIGDYVIRADNNHSMLGKVYKLQSGGFGYPIAVQWVGSRFPYHYKTSQLTIVTKEDNPEYFI